MLKEAIEYVVGISEPHFKEVDGKLFSDKDMKPVHDGREPKALGFNTLDGILRYALFSDELADKELYLHVESPDEVLVHGALNRNCGRYVYARANAMLPRQSFGDYMDQESFGIYLRTHFVHDETVDRLLAFSGTVTGDDVQVLVDDGVSQQVTVRSMVQGNRSAIAPNECALRPYRTFYEVEQPGSPFVFRCKKQGDVIGFALYEADGGLWKYRAMEDIKSYMQQFYEEHCLKDRTVRIMM